MASDLILVEADGKCQFVVGICIVNFIQIFFFLGIYPVASQYQILVTVFIKPSKSSLNILSSCLILTERGLFKYPMMIVYFSISSLSSVNFCFLPLKTCY